MAPRSTNQPRRCSSNDLPLGHRHLEADNCHMDLQTPNQPQLEAPINQSINQSITGSSKHPPHGLWKMDWSIGSTDAPMLFVPFACTGRDHHEMHRHLAFPRYTYGAGERGDREVNHRVWEVPTMVSCRNFTSNIFKPLTPKQLCWKEQR